MRCIICGRALHDRPGCPPASTAGAGASTPLAAGWALHRPVTNIIDDKGPKVVFTRKRKGQPDKTVRAGRRRPPAAASQLPCRCSRPSLCPAPPPQVAHRPSTLEKVTPGLRDEDSEELRKARRAVTRSTTRGGGKAGSGAAAAKTGKKESGAGAAKKKDGGAKPKPSPKKAAGGGKGKGKEPAAPATPRAARASKRAKR